MTESRKIPFNDYGRNSAEAIASKKQPIAITADDKAKVQKRRALEERMLLRELGVGGLFDERITE